MPAAGRRLTTRRRFIEGAASAAAAVAAAASPRIAFAQTSDEYDYVVVNDQLEPTVVRLQEIIAAERSRTHRMRHVAEGIITTFKA